MKYLIVSDIHGSLPALQQVLHFFETQGCDMLCILGDILNYGPRNRIPEGLDPQGIVSRLNALADRIVAVRGNCDAEVDQMLLDFPMLADYALVVDGGRRLFLTHGHIYHAGHRPVGRPDVLFCGHTHLWQLQPADDGTVICNTGSITFPKGGNEPTFATYEAGHITMWRLDGVKLRELDV